MPVYPRDGRFRGVPTELEITVEVEAFGAEMGAATFSEVLDAALADPFLMGPAISSRPTERLVKSRPRPSRRPRQPVGGAMNKLYRVQLATHDESAAR